MANPYKAAADSSRRAKGGNIGDAAQDRKMIQAAIKAHENKMHRFSGGNTGNKAYLPASARDGKTPAIATKSMARGGRLGMTAGAETGEGRLQKAHKY